MRSPYVIRSITIQNDGTAIEYINVRTDIRANGLQVSHVVFIPAGDDYDDELDGITMAAQEALADALQDMDNLEPLPPEVILGSLQQPAPDEDGDDDEDDPSTT